VDAFQVNGANDFLRLSKALKEAGEKELRKQLHKGLRDAVKKVMPDAEKKLAENLPYLRGKAVNQVAQVKTGRDPGVTVGVRYGSRRSTNARLANSKGVFRHPVYADGEKTRKQWRWVDQSVPGAKGWFDQTYLNAAPEIRRAIEVVMGDLINEIVRKAK
jgi:hypothetical protein